MIIDNLPLNTFLVADPPEHDIDEPNLTELLRERVDPIWNCENIEILDPNLTCERIDTEDATSCLPATESLEAVSSVAVFIVTPPSVIVPALLKLLPHLAKLLTLNELPKCT